MEMKEKDRTVCVLFDEPAEQELLIDFLQRSRHPFAVASNQNEALFQLQLAAYPVVLLKGDPRDHLRWLQTAKHLSSRVKVLLIALREGEGWMQSPLIDHVVQPFDFPYLSHLLDLPEPWAAWQSHNA